MNPQNYSVVQDLSFQEWKLFVGQGSTVLKYHKKNLKRPEEYRISLNMDSMEFVWDPLTKKKGKKTSGSLIINHTF